ncbi:Plexin domain-containing protein [Schistosoma japonicum]|nr:Plexin domain-containing protein [Schistosoma japonicum]
MSTYLMISSLLYFILLLCSHCLEYSLIHSLTNDNLINEEIISNGNEDYGKLIWENESYRQSYHYYYTQLIRLDQSSPVAFDKFNETLITSISYLKVNGLFPIKYYGVQYDSLNILSKGIVGIGKSFRHSGSTKKIEVFNGMNKNGGVETINTNKFLAIRWINLSISTLHEDETEDFAGLYIIKTSYSMIKTPESMIKSRTLVEFTPNTICSEQTFCETCINASSVSGKCYWCPVISKCSHGYDIHRPTWMFKSCYIKNTTNCEKLTASKYTENYEINSTEQTSISYPNISQKYFKNNTQTSEKSTTNLANFTTTKYELRTNKLPSSTSNDKILENSGISLPLYLIIPILAALAVIFLIIICALCLGVCKKKSKKRRKPNTLQISE